MSSTNIREDPLTKTTDEAKKNLLIPKEQAPGLSIYDEQSTSTGIKAQYSLNINTRPEAEEIVKRSYSLSSLDELAARLLKAKMEEDASFVTVEGCQQEVMTSTEPAIIFSRNERTQNILLARNTPSYNQPPPPYDYDDRNAYQGRIGRTPIYQERYPASGSIMPQDASRTPPYRRNYIMEVDSFDMFDSKEIRNRFVKKVYMILTVQLLVSFGMIVFCIYYDPAKKFVQQNVLWLLVSMIVYFVLIIILFCYEESRRIFPLNFILLSLLTIAMAYLTAAISCYYKTYIVMAAMGVTSGVCLLISLLACQHWFDVTECGMALCISALIVMIYGIIAVVITMLTGSNIAYLIYSCLITLLFCMFLMYDTQQILGGRRIELSPEEYILAALTLYVDIMTIFQSILQICGSTIR